MRRAILILVAFAVAIGLAGGAALAQQGRVIDRIVAHIEDDILLASEVRELGRYQQLVDGHASTDDRLLAELIDQWIVEREAAAARFARPPEADVRAEVEQLEKQFPSPQAYRARLAELDLTEVAVRRLVERQLYLTRYLDYKFRPAVQVDAGAIEKYYREEFLPELARRGQQAPPLESVQDTIRELLTEREISARASRWLDETRGRLKVEIVPEPKGSGGPVK